MSSSPLRPGATIEQELEFYKSQYTQLEADLADFQASSKELEEQLERDIEAAEKNERKLKEQVERLNFEVEEWKGKHKQAKLEANSAQTVLQKEVTVLREAKRGLELKLRDVEVVNDDYERQQRNTEASREDLEGKLNVAIERGVMQEEDIKVGELEREALRIETQRLRDELGDLRVESEITVEKLRLADNTIERLRTRKPSPLAVESLRARSPAGSEGSGITPSSTTASTPPPTKSEMSEDAGTPPSPPLSDAPLHHNTTEAKASAPDRRRSLLPDAAATPRPSLYGPRAAAAPRAHARGPSIASSTGTSATSDAKAMRPPPSKPKRPSTSTAGEGLPRSDSLYQIKALRGRMQKIEERVHSARSKLPPPGTRTPTKSPRPQGGDAERLLPGSVTMRRSMKRPSGSMVSSLAFGGETATDSDAPAERPSRRESHVNDRTADNDAPPEYPARRESHIKRLSYGIPRPSIGDRPLSGLERPTSALGRPGSSAGGVSRPSSRGSLVSASVASRPESRTGSRMSGYVGTAANGGRPESRTGLRTSTMGGQYGGSASNGARPESRSESRTSAYASTATNSGRPESRTGSRTAAANQAATTNGTHRVAQPRSSVGGSTPSTTVRPRSSMGGASNYATIRGNGTIRSHRPSASVSELRRKAVTDTDETPAFAAGLYSSPSRRTTMERQSALPGSARKLGGGGVASPVQTTGKTLRRVSNSTSAGLNGLGAGEMRPPPSRRKMSDVGETY